MSSAEIKIFAGNSNEGLAHKVAEILEMPLSPNRLFELLHGADG